MKKIVKKEQKILVVNKLNAYATNIFGHTNKDAQILFNVSFSLPKGKICAFIGHNGAGKTTTIKSILGLREVKKGNGTIQVLGYSNIDPKCRRKIGYIPEKGNIEKMKAIDFLVDMGKFYNLTKEQIINRVATLLKEFNLEKNRLNVKLNKLSSGQNKIITIIQAFLSDNELIIADEPTDNLDPEARDLFWNFIIKFHKSNPSTTVFLITHNLDEVEKYTDYTVYLDHGRIRYEGSYNRSAGLRKKYQKMRDK
jgi:ABC-2 type transport system ATP-binding protein